VLMRMMRTSTFRLGPSSSCDGAFNEPIRSRLASLASALSSISPI